MSHQDHKRHLQQVILVDVLVGLVPVGVWIAGRVVVEGVQLEHGGGVGAQRRVPLVAHVSLCAARRAVVLGVRALHALVADADLEAEIREQAVHVDAVLDVGHEEAVLAVHVRQTRGHVGAMRRAEQTRAGHDRVGTVVDGRGTAV